VGRVVATLIDGHTREAYQYDVAGAVFAGDTREYGRGGRLLRRGNVEYVYDDEGRLVEKRADAGTTAYTWDGRGLLAAVVLPDGNGVEFAYDAFARRIRKRTLRAGVTLAETHFRWDGSALAYEREERGAGHDGRDPQTPGPAGPERAVRERCYVYEPG